MTRRTTKTELRHQARFLLCCLVLLTAFCDRQRTEEDAVHEFIGSLIRLAEQKDLDGMMVCFAEEFEDFEGRDKESLKSLLAGYFSGRRGIVVHRLSGRLVRLEGGKAEYETEVALSSGGGGALRRLIRVSPDIYRLLIELTKDGEEWRIAYAEWSWISLAELLPESLSALKKIFPKL